MTAKFLEKHQGMLRNYFINRETRRLFTVQRPKGYFAKEHFVKYELDYSKYGICFYKKTSAKSKNLPKGQYRPITERYFTKIVNSHKTIIKLSCIAGKSHEIIKRNIK